jgi:hypothetical protein
LLLRFPCGQFTIVRYSFAIILHLSGDSWLAVTTLAMLREPFNVDQTTTPASRARSMCTGLRCLTSCLSWLRTLGKFLPLVRVIENGTAPRPGQGAAVPRRSQVLRRASGNDRGTLGTSHVRRGGTVLARSCSMLGIAGTALILTPRDGQSQATTVSNVSARAIAPRRRRETAAV